MAEMSVSGPKLRAPPRWFATKLRCMRQRVHDWGWARAAYWEIMNGLARAVGFHIHAVTVSADRPEARDDAPPVIAECYTVKWGTREDYLPFVGRISGLDQPFVDDAFARGDDTVVVFHGDELVGFSFVSRTWARVTPQLRIEIPPGFRYGYKAWTHPDHRRQNLSNARNHLRVTTQAAAFEERSLSYVETHNYASLLHGYRHPNKRWFRFGYIGWITVLGRQIPFHSRHAKRLGLRLVRAPDRA